MGSLKEYAKAMFAINEAKANDSDRLDLSSLKLGSDSLENLMKSIKELRGLKFLILEDNELFTLPDGIEMLTTLEKLSVRKNHLTALPAAIGALTSLELLDARENQLSGLPEDIGKLTKLRILALYDNYISELPSQMAGLSSLRTLILGKNKCKSFPEVLLQLKSLEELDLGENRLTALPQEFGDLKALKLLDLYQNHFWFFPQGILKLEALEKLNMASNKLQKLPAELVNLQQLEILDLQYNTISVLPQKFGNLVNLQHLNLRNNRLQKLPDSFGALAGLEVVDLSKNALGALPNSLVNLIPGLRLTLDFNRLPPTDRQLLVNNFNRFSRVRSDAQNAANRYQQVLAQLYPHTSEAILYQIENIGLGALEVTLQLSRNAVDVLKEFLNKIPLEHAHAKAVYLPAVQFLLDRVLNKNLPEEERQLTLQKMLTALGDCGTPVNHFLTQTFVFECMDKGEGIPDEVQDTLKAMAVEKAISTKFKEQLKGRPEAIELVAALLHSLFLKNAAVMKWNTVKIQGTSVSLPPFSRNVKFGFTQIPKELAAAFLKLCCQEKDGQLLQQEGKYLQDPKKINAMVAPFLADLDPTLASPRELLVRDYKEILETLLLKHDLTSWTDKEEVKELLKTHQRQEDLRALLQDVPDEKIHDTYHEFLRKKEFEIFCLDFNCNTKPKATALLALMTASIQRKEPSENAEQPSTKQKVKLSRSLSM